MIPLKKECLLYFLFFTVLKAYAQEPARIRFQKSAASFYFFQRGVTTDTIRKNRGDVFYLVVPDSLKEAISIQVENAQLVRESNDSLVRINHVPGIRYESVYRMEHEEPGAKRGYVLKSRVNGASALPRHKIRIGLTVPSKGETILENVFYFLPAD